MSLDEAYVLAEESFEQLSAFKREHTDKGSWCRGYAQALCDQSKVETAKPSGVPHVLPRGGSL